VDRDHSKRGEVMERWSNGVMGNRPDAFRARATTTPLLQHSTGCLRQLKRGVFHSGPIATQEGFAEGALGGTSSIFALSCKKFMTFSFMTWS
jgi:hypothetical protein